MKSFLCFKLSTSGRNLRSRQTFIGAQKQSLLSKVARIESPEYLGFSSLTKILSNIKWIAQHCQTFESLSFRVLARGKAYLSSTNSSTPNSKSRFGAHWFLILFWFSYPPSLKTHHVNTNRSIIKWLTTERIANLYVSQKLSRNQFIPRFSHYPAYPTKVNSKSEPQKWIFSSTKCNIVKSVRYKRTDKASCSSLTQNQK